MMNCLLSFLIIISVCYGLVVPKRSTATSPRFRTDRPVTNGYTTNDETIQKQIDEYLVARNTPSHHQRQIDEYLTATNNNIAPSSERDNVQSTSLLLSPTAQKVDDKNLMQQIKDSGIAGIVSFALVQLTFWALSAPLVIIAFYKISGHFPDFGDSDDMAKLGAEAFTYLNIARLAAPFRIGVSLSLVPWIQTNIVDQLRKDKTRQ